MKKYILYPQVYYPVLTRLIVLGIGFIIFCVMLALATI